MNDCFLFWKRFFKCLPVFSCLIKYYWLQANYIYNGFNILLYVLLLLNFSSLSRSVLQRTPVISNTIAKERTFFPWSSFLSCDGCWKGKKSSRALSDFVTWRILIYTFRETGRRKKERREKGRKEERKRKSMLPRISSIFIERLQSVKDLIIVPMASEIIIQIQI